MLLKNYKVCRDLNELAAYINDSDAVALDFETAPLDGQNFSELRSFVQKHRYLIVLVVASAGFEPTLQG